MARNYVDVLGTIWWPVGSTAAMRYNVSAHDIENMRNEDDGLIERDDVEQWLGTHSGDFSSITDFAAYIDGQEYDWEHEDSEWTYHDCMYPDED